MFSTWILKSLNSRKGSSTAFFWQTAFFSPLNFWRCEMREKKWSGLGSVWSQELSLSFSLVANNCGLQGLAVELLLAQHSALAGFSSCLPAVDLGRSPEQWHPRGGGGGKGAQIIQSSMGISPRGEKKSKYFPFRKIFQIFLNISKSSSF